MAASLLMAELSARSGAGTSEVACARAEAGALLMDVIAGGAATGRVHRMGVIHKRLWAAGREGYLEWDRLSGFREAQCTGAPADALMARRRYAIDPWGTAYWIRVERAREGERRVVLYSFGPNRRRDGPPGSGGGDDVAVVGVLRAAAPVP